MSSNARRRTTVISSGAAHLADVVKGICSEYQSKLDANHFEASGQEPPSVNFVPFQIALGSFAQQAWRQLHDGTMKRSDGTPVNNINTLINNKVDDLDRYVTERYEGDIGLAQGDPAVHRLCLQIEQLEAQRDMMVEFLEGFKAAYKHYFKKDWEPYIAPTSTTAKPKTTETVNKQMEAAAARLAARKAAATTAA